MWMVVRPDGSITDHDWALPAWTRKQAIQSAGYDWNWKAMKRAGFRCLPCLIVFMLSACVGAAPTPVASSCGTPAMAIIHPSPQDTDDTLRQILLHNESARAQCPDAG